MMFIPDKNETIYQVIYTSIVGQTSMKALKEFGFFSYFIFPAENGECKFFFIIFLLALTMGFSALDFDKIYEFSGKEFLETEFKEFKCTPKQQLGGQVFDLCITVDLTKFKKVFGKKKKIWQMKKKKNMMKKEKVLDKN